MKKTVAKAKAKPAKTEPARKAPPKVSAHDPLHNLLRGAYTSKVCR